MIEFKYNDGEPAGRVDLAGRVRTLTWSNTVIFCHLDRWRVFDHLYVDQELPTLHLPIYVFRDTVENFDEIVNQLRGENYPYRFDPIPLSKDVEEFMEQQTSDLRALEVTADET
ncbi:MAG TPA: hypothetical protein VIH90_06400 [Candidatus Saccharimonadales bacterium]